MPPIPIIKNNTSGSGSEDELEQLLKLPDNNMFHLYIFEPENINNLITDLYKRGYRSIVAAGGDGTVSAIAGAVVESGLDIKMGVLPVGTLNHFAKDIGMPSNLGKALEIFKNGKSSQIDIAKVNDIYFINNSSLGIYPKIVKKRENKQEKGLSKTRALFSAIIEVFKSDNSISVEFESENKKIIRNTPFVFIGNNKYEVSGIDIGERKKLDEGILFICTTKKISKFRILALGIRAILGNILKDDDFNVIGLHSLTITSREKSMSVSHDGEVSRISTPLQYAILPKALSVIIP